MQVSGTKVEISGRQIMAHHPIPKCMAKENLVLWGQTGHVASTAMPNKQQHHIKISNPTDHLVREPKQFVKRVYRIQQWVCRWHTYQVLRIYTWCHGEKKNEWYKVELIYKTISEIEYIAQLMEYLNSSCFHARFIMR